MKPDRKLEKEYSKLYDSLSKQEQELLTKFSLYSDKLVKDDLAEYIKNNNLIDSEYKKILIEHLELNL